VDPQRTAVTGRQRRRTQSMILAAMTTASSSPFPSHGQHVDAGRLRLRKRQPAAGKPGNVEFAALFAPRPQA